MDRNPGRRGGVKKENSRTPAFSEGEGMGQRYPPAFHHEWHREDVRRSSEEESFLFFHPIFQDLFCWGPNVAGARFS